MWVTNLICKIRGWFQDPDRGWPDGWSLDEKHRTAYLPHGQFVRTDGIHLIWEAGMWIRWPDGKTAAGHDPEDRTVNPRDVMEFVNQTYPLHTEHSPNKYDRRWNEISSR